MSAFYSLFRSGRSRNKQHNQIPIEPLETFNNDQYLNVHSRSQYKNKLGLLMQHPYEDDWLNYIKQLNVSCCRGDDKDKKSQPTTKTIVQAQVRGSVDVPKIISDHKIDEVKFIQVKQHESPAHDIKKLYGREKIMEKLVAKLQAREVTQPMNIDNDILPILNTKKHVIFSNEPLTIKPVTAIPGIGPIMGKLAEKHGIIMAYDMLARYMNSAGDKEFVKSLINDIGFTKKSAFMVRDAMKDTVRHTI
ncbi:unnamed protein product [Didymodactylos carnosus]|uniref:Uncharacterized protein n=1 Tax=Didymodactylos carnosus TaxID=1234261 RepID=A0A814D5C8_9BILA|nr:unnamed protein product [Didymodactylos carnosus]CAF1502946.1 unnamed protein product [Didymodactylos carnosus]CAF3725350.1 unnamed protein product [Didymodactylos carnosus]CAF4291262.1 unnamed protein product [Didymodactylos carnosus]